MRRDFIKLGDICNIQTGPFGSQLHSNDYSLNGTPIVTVEHLGNRKFTLQNLPHVKEEDRIRLQKYNMKEGDIIFSRVGSVDRCTYVFQNNVGWLFSGRCLRIRVESECLCSLFLYYYFCLDEVKLYIRNIAVGATMPSINTKLLQNIEIILPSLVQQKRIAYILSSLDDKIELNNRINQNLEEQAQALFKRWFVDFEFPNEEGKPYKSSGGEMVESELGEIPEGWKVGKLGDIAIITTGKRPINRISKQNINAKVPIIGASSIMGYTSKLLYEERILVIGRVGTHGVIQRYSSPCWTSDNTLVLKSNYYEYTYHILSMIDYKNLNRGSTQPLITQNDITNSKIIIVDNYIANRFEQVSGTLMSLCEKHTIENQTLSKLRDYLLPKLMNNQI